MADFDQAVQRLLQKEGGFAPEDNGRGAVKYGITARTLAGFGIKKQVADLTPQDARDIYLKFFWTPSRIGELRDQELAETFFDAVVNLWSVRPVKYLQNTANGLGAGLMVDGRCGALTIEALNRLIDKGYREALLEGFKDHLETEYRRLANENPDLYGDDLSGWLGRIGRPEKRQKAGHG